MSLEDSMKFNSFEPPDPSWLYITCAVVTAHCILIGSSLFFESPIVERQPKPATRLSVQTIALNSNPIPRNPIPKNPMPRQPISPIRIEPTPLEHGTNSPPTYREPPQQKVEAPKPVEEIPAEVTPPPTAPPIKPKSVSKPAIKSVAKPVVKPTEKPAKPTPQPDSLNKSVKKPNPSPPKTPPKPVIKAPVNPHINRSTIDRTSQELKKKQSQEEQKKQEESSQKEAAQLAEKERQQKLVIAAQERIAKITGSRNAAASKSTGKGLSSLPQAIASLEIDSLNPLSGGSSLSPHEMTYREEIAARLKLLLRLPEYGDVKVNLTLDRTGKVFKIAIVNAESTANRKYIEKTLPEMSFPGFGTNFASSTITFAITLSNEI